jgi:hypothetical protein
LWEKIYRSHRKKFDNMFKGHFLSFNNNRNNSKLSEQLLQNGHSFGKINDIMAKLYSPKGNTLGNREKVYIYKESTTGN